MNIVVIGCGTVGAAVSAQLVKEGHAVTVVDTDEGALTELANAYDVGAIQGNGADISVLRKAGAEKADLLIAITCEDEINILCCAAAKKLGTGHTIARVRNPEYSELMHLMREEMSLSLTVNPELAAAREIYRMLRFPAAAKIGTCCHGRVELVEFAVTGGSPLCGTSLFDLRNKWNIKFLVCGVRRGERVYIPSGDFVIEDGDEICITASDEELTRLFKAIGVYKQPVRDVLIVGGGRITYYLEELLRAGKISSTVIEKDRELCRELAQAHACTVVCDNGTKQDLLLEEGLERADAFLALTDTDEENAIVSMFARTKHVRKVVTLIRGMPYIDFFKGVGLESIVSPKSSTTSHILRYVRAMANTRDSSEMESLHAILNGGAEALEFVVKEDIDGLTNVPLRELRSRRGVLIACILRGDAMIFPAGNDEIHSGDTVIVVTTGGQMNSMKDILE
ncbi:MAG: Trk system potassium transporter TrkA [Clostridia bacterium]|nr:Trk system potassium transporter TrkA [Clostridia bacterium]